MSGNYRLHSKNRAAGATTFTKASLKAGSRYNVSMNTGLQVGDLYGRVTMNYSAGYRIYNWSSNPTTGTGPWGTAPNTLQRHVDAFYPVDLFLRYDLGQRGPTKAMQLTLNVDNVFEQDPPTLRTTGQIGHVNGQ